MKIHSLLSPLSLAVFLAALTPASAVTIYSHRVAWEAGLPGGWHGAQVDLASQVAEFEVLVAGSPLVLPSGALLSFDVDLEGLQVPDSWATWSGSQTPRVLYSGIDNLSVVGVFSEPVWAFGMEMQPDGFWEDPLTLLLSDGSTLTQVVDGYAGAAFFGWIAHAGDPEIGGVTLSGEIEFAFGRLVQAQAGAVPDAGLGWLSVWLAMGALCAWRRLRN